MLTTSNCNLQCSYCYTKASRRNIQNFDINNVKVLIKNSSIGFDSIEFCWHGGEPLLVGRKFYNEVIKYQKEETQRRDVTFYNRLQTNGILIDTVWMDFFRKNGFHFGISLDAPSDIYPIHRKTNVNNLLKTCEIIKKENFPLGVLCVISKLNVSRGVEIFDWYKSLGVNSFGLLPLKCVPLSSKPLAPTNEELFHLYKSIFDLWMWTPNEFSCIEPLDTMIRSMLGQPPKGCSFANSCLKKMITIDQNGNVIPCSSLTADNFILGNILEKPLNKILMETKTKQLRKQRTRHVNKHCGQCKYIAICRGGCRANAYWATGKYDGDYPFCEARVKTFDYIEQTFQNISKTQRTTL